MTSVPKPPDCMTTTVHIHFPWTLCHLPRPLHRTSPHLRQQGSRCHVTGSRAERRFLLIAIHVGSPGHAMISPGQKKIRVGGQQEFHTGQGSGQQDPGQNRSVQKARSAGTPGRVIRTSGQVRSAGARAGQVSRIPGPVRSEQGLPSRSDQRAPRIRSAQ